VAVSPPRHQPEELLVDALTGTVPTHTGGRRDWLAADPYLRRHLAGHAAYWGRLEQLLAEPEFLVAAEPARLLPSLDTITSSAGERLGWMYRSCVHPLRTDDPAERVAYLRLAASQHGLGELADQLTPIAAAWAREARSLCWRPLGRFTSLGKADAAPRGVTITSQGETFVVTGGGDGVRCGRGGSARTGWPRPGPRNPPTWTRRTLWDVIRTEPSDVWRTVAEHGYAHIARPFVTPEDAWQRADALISEIGSPDGLDAPIQVIGQFVVPPPGSAPSRDFQTLHFDFGIPLLPSAQADVARWTALHVPADCHGITARTRLAPIPAAQSERRSG
jgi:hypothetical protein